MATLIVVQARYSDFYRYITGGYEISYHLSQPLEFSEPHYARLFDLTGVGRPCLVYADFAKPQQVNGELAPLLGLHTNSNHHPTWVPIENSISATGLLEVYRADGDNMTEHGQDRDHH